MKPKYKCPYFGDIEAVLNCEYGESEEECPCICEDGNGGCYNELIPDNVGFELFENK